jgi:hypothetical protein
MSWSEIKKSINSDLNVPLNELIDSRIEAKSEELLRQMQIYNFYEMLLGGVYQHGKSQSTLSKAITIGLNESVKKELLFEVNGRGQADTFSSQYGLGSNFGNIQPCTFNSNVAFYFDEGEDNEAIVTLYVNNSSPTSVASSSSASATKKTLTASTNHNYRYSGDQPANLWSFSGNKRSASVSAYKYSTTASDVTKDCYNIPFYFNKHLRVYVTYTTGSAASGATYDTQTLTVSCKYQLYNTEAEVR